MEFGLFVKNPYELRERLQEIDNVLKPPTFFSF
jgi:hypothetical protein